MLQPVADIVLSALMDVGEIDFAAGLVKAGLHTSLGGLQALLEALAEPSKDREIRTVSTMVCTCNL